jgi:hypothetical protein
LRTEKNPIMLHFEGPLEMGCGPTNPPQNSPNDHLITLKTLDPVYHKELRLALGFFTVCQAENVLHEAGISTIAQIGKARHSKNINKGYQK